MVLDALLWRRTAAAAVLSPSTQEVCTALAIMLSDVDGESTATSSGASEMPKKGI